MGDETGDDDVAAWARFCERMSRLGDRLGDDDFPAPPTDRADGVAHLAEQALCWTGWSVFHADPRRPFFHRQNDLVTPWGGPNADNVYRHARVEPGRRYRIRGRMHACEEWVLAVRRGFMHQPTWGTVFEITATDLGLGPGDEIDLLVGGDGPVPLPEGALMVSIREYYLDWREAEPATFTIECLDDDADAPAGRVEPGEVARRLAEAADGVEHSIEYWNRYMREKAAERPRNTFGATFGLAKGLDAARYGFCFWELGPDDALVVELDEPVARYWSLQLYEMAWFELVDITERQSSLNQAQLVVDDDAKVRVVVSHTDPRVANWLDAGGRGEGLVSLRCFWAAEAPDARARAVPVAEVLDHLPADTATIDAAARAEVLRARRRHLAWRFRT